MAKTLIAYFSHAGQNYSHGSIKNLKVGNTEVAAKKLHDMIDSDLFFIDTVQKYPDDHMEKIAVAKREFTENARPALSSKVENMEDYDTVIVAFPNWWGDWPMIMYTVFENNDFSGKRLVPFSTHEGSGLSGFDRKLASACPGSEIFEGLAVRGNDAQNKQDNVRETLNDWLTGLGY